MESLKQYFERRDTPSANSPVGTLISRISEKFPGMPLGDARAKAHGMLSKAARAFNFRIPAVRSAEGEAAQKAIFAAFKAKRSKAVNVSTQ